MTTLVNKTFIQCCASLLSEWISKEEKQFSGSLVKILYILHWLLLDSANECCDFDNENVIICYSTYSALFILFLKGKNFQDISCFAQFFSAKNTGNLQSTKD